MKVLVVLCLAITIACSSAPKSDDEVRIGFFGPMTGNMAYFGTAVSRGVELAMDDINQKGLNGKKLRLFVEDDRGSPEEAQSAVSRLITRDRVVAVLGNPSSSGSLAAAPVCQQHKIPMITPTATNIKVTQAGDYIFRVCWIDPFQGEIMARFAVEKLKAKKLAVLFDVASDYSTGLKDVFIRTAEEHGASTISRESFTAGDTNFSAQLTNVKNSGAEVLFLPVYYNDAGLIMRQLRAMGSSMTAIGADGWDSPDLLSIGGDAVNGSFYCTHFLPEDPAPAVQQFVTFFQKKHQSLPSMGEALAYDAVQILADAMKRSSFTEPQKIRDALASTSNFAGVTGTITIDQNRNAVKPAILVKIEGQRPVFVEKMEPVR